jgi:hydroxymethylpyrimidine pyrophosphatase-like HAD family hydrolase
MHRDATKINAIKILCEKWGITISDVVAFGDDSNDIDMLRGCGKGIAMGNAIDAVKEVSCEVCDTNENDGMAIWLIQNVLKDG